MSDLEAIKARAEAATEGPWHIDHDERTVRAIDPANGKIMFNRAGTPHRHWQQQGQADAEFIAHARDDVPRLVAALEAVENLHRPYTQHPSGIGAKYCVHCWDGIKSQSTAYPCPTVTAIRTALEGAPE